MLIYCKQSLSLEQYKRGQKKNLTQPRHNKVGITCFKNDKNVLVRNNKIYTKVGSSNIHAHCPKRGFVLQLVVCMT